VLETGHFLYRLIGNQGMKGSGTQTVSHGSASNSPFNRTDNRLLSSFGNKVLLFHDTV